jgi:hypothetical protein
MPVTRPKISEKPAVQAVELNFYISDRLRSGSIDIHSAFQLHHEAVRIERFSYRQPAWGHRLYLHGLHKIFMHGLTAHALGCKEQAALVEDWFIEDTPLLREDRPHHFGDRVASGKSLFQDRSFLQLLADMRRTCDERLLQGGCLDEDQVPYHFSEFPYSFAAPEQELLWPGTCPEFDRNAPFDHEVEEILVELLTGIWA